MQLQKLDTGFMYFGTGPANFSLEIPYPSVDGALFQTARSVDAARNANNVVVGQMVGRSVDKQNMKWNRIDTETWWKMNRWLEANGMFFWCRYFAHSTGEWRVRRFYVGDISCEPVDVDAASGKAAYYKNASFNIIDTGA